jgi:hypothetical protein
MGLAITTFANVQTPLINIKMLTQQHEDYKAGRDKTWVYYRET